MATLPTKSFNQIVADTVSGVQGRAEKLLNFSQGSTLRAIVEGFAGLFLWFQALVLQVLLSSRLSTSSGTDVDTFTVDFMPAVPGSKSAALPNGSPRLGAQSATGQVTYSRLTAAPSQCLISVGATVQTFDRQSSFVVISDPTYATFDPTLNGYVLASSVASIIVPVSCVVAGVIGNVQAGAISLMTSPVTGIDNVTNVAAFINGVDQESDNGLKTRFAAYILGLSRGDYYGLNASIEGSGVNVQWTLTEDYNYDGSWHPGYFFVIADDGSGNPPASLLATVRTAAEAVRPLSIQCAVFAPIILFAAVSMQITTGVGYDHNTVVAQVEALIGTNIKSLGLGNPLPFSILSAWAYSVPGVTQVSGVLLNGASGDAASMLATKLTQDGTFKIKFATIKPGTITVS